MKPRFLYVRVLTPKQKLFEGEALSVSSVNSMGRFDILPEHANFITIVEYKPIEIRQLNKYLLTFQFTQAIIFAMDNRVSIYAEPQLIT